MAYSLEQSNLSPGLQVIAAREARNEANLVATLELERQSKRMADIVALLRKLGWKLDPDWLRKHPLLLLKLGGAPTSAELSPVENALLSPAMCQQMFPLLCELMGSSMGGVHLSIHLRTIVTQARHNSQIFRLEGHQLSMVEIMQPIISSSSDPLPSIRIVSEITDGNFFLQKMLYGFKEISPILSKKQRHVLRQELIKVMNLIMDFDPSAGLIVRNLDFVEKMSQSRQVLLDLELLLAPLVDQHAEPLLAAIIREFQFDEGSPQSADMVLSVQAKVDDNMENGSTPAVSKRQEQLFLHLLKHFTQEVSSVTARHLQRILRLTLVRTSQQQSGSPDYFLRVQFVPDEQPVEPNENISKPGSSTALLVSCLRFLISRTSDIGLELGTPFHLEQLPATY